MCNISPCVVLEAEAEKAPVFAEVLQPCMGACQLPAGSPEEAGLPGAALRVEG